jgi:hypothetical protein
VWADERKCQSAPAALKASQHHPATAAHAHPKQIDAEPA